jgi:outer membrane protein OmpA-like peptidoglycan-associated protein
MQAILRTVLILLFISEIGLSQQDGRKYNAFSGAAVLTVDGGPTIGRTDYTGIRPDYFGRASLEYFFPAYSRSSIGIRGFGGGGYIAGKDVAMVPDIFRTKMKFLGSGLIYAININDVVVPYVFLGASYLWFDPYGNNGVRLTNNLNHVYKKTEVDYNGELGFRFLVTKNLSLNLSGGVQLSPNDYLDDKAIGVNNDYFYFANVGISFSFFGDFDNDGDGVPDSKDICPNTPSGITVDSRGCPLDSDGDGVPDYLDKCPNTPKGAPVDRDGCPLDSDGDGVPDYKDVCPNTPAGVRVDELGCPLDSDGDGVPDYLDKCLNTPAGVQVDKDGCPLDSDHDGVPDYLDKCPDTGPGVKVDSSGCPIKIVVEKVQVPEQPAEEVGLRKIILNVETYFIPGKNKLLPSAYIELDKLLKIMKEEQTSRWKIAGYTDNKSSDKVSRSVSAAHANAVLSYFISRGISKKRFQVVGLGKASPIAANSNEQGRMMNRRVEVTRIK